MYETREDPYLVQAQTVLAREQGRLEGRSRARAEAARRDTLVFGAVILEVLGYGAYRQMKSRKKRRKR